ncbi:MAG: hypothetical protein NC086_00230 [Alistipes sp.]|nr:hypothetical protein [Alistipes sp.]
MKKIILVAVLVAIVVGYYYYLSNRVIDTSDTEAAKEEVEKLITRNLEGDYYPQLQRDVVTYYSRIMKAYYYSPLTDEQIEGLGKQARNLFDEELLERNPEEEFYENLKADIKEYNKAKRKILEYKVQSSSEIKTFTFQKQTFSIVRAVYYMKDASSVYQDYVLRKDENGQWKILFWELVKPVNYEKD